MSGRPDPNWTGPNDPLTEVAVVLRVVLALVEVALRLQVALRALLLLVLQARQVVQLLPVVLLVVRVVLRGRWSWGPW